MSVIQGKLLGANLFAYCGNNPTNYSDPTGYFAAALAGFYFVPGIGEVLITATVAVIILGITIAACSWIAKTVVKWINSKAKVMLAARENQHKVATKYGLKGKQLTKFKEEIEGRKRKSGKRNDDNFSWAELCAIAEWVRRNYNP